MFCMIIIWSTPTFTTSFFPSALKSANAIILLVVPPEVVLLIVVISLGAEKLLSEKDCA